MSTDDIFYGIAFASLRGMTPAIATAIEEFDPSMTAARVFTLGEDELCRFAGDKAKGMFSRASLDRALKEAEHEVEWMEKNGVRPLLRHDEGYPERLRECEDAPLCLYTLGNTNLNDRAVISIVGTRRATAYGIDFVNRVVSDLTERLAHKPIVVSGLALGIDIAAHRAALAAGTPTAAVMATGLNSLYPACHRRDAASIIEHGGMLATEYRSIDATHRGNFLARNRIVAGLSDITLLVESDIKGGAMNTARLAGDYNRQVGALPGRTSDRFSRGCNEMIVAQRAAMVRDADDIINLTGWKLKTDSATAVQQSLFPELDPVEARIIELLTERGDIHLSSLVALCDLPYPRLSAKLMEMEFRNLIMQLPGGHYRLK